MPIFFLFRTYYVRCTVFQRTPATMGTREERKKVSGNKSAISSRLIFTHQTRFFHRISYHLRCNYHIAAHFFIAIRTLLPPIYSISIIRCLFLHSSYQCTRHSVSWSLAIYEINCQKKYEKRNEAFWNTICSFHLCVSVFARNLFIRWLYLMNKIPYNFI